jgi:lipoprotein-anchoring transpeptidase ErfK/SrfK
VGNVPSVRTGWRNRVLIALIATLSVLLTTPPAVAHSPAKGLPEISLPEGKAIVFSHRSQRLWIVRDGVVIDTWKITTSRTIPYQGQYRVYSKSARSVTLDGKISFQHMVRFTKGPLGIAIGFHDIPRWTSNQQLLMKESDLGSKSIRSSGCIRQAPANAQRLYSWASIGTPVFVVR